MEKNEERQFLICMEKAICFPKRKTWWVFHLQRKKIFSVVQISVVYFFSVSSLNTGHAETVYHNSARVYLKLTRKLLTIRVWFILVSFFIIIYNRQHGLFQILFNHPAGGAVKLYRIYCAIIKIDHFSSSRVKGDRCSFCI